MDGLTDNYIPKYQYFCLSIINTFILLHYLIQNKIMFVLTHTNHIHV